MRCCAISCITISIHALLAESDINGFRHRWASFYFYPRSPCGERRPPNLSSMSDRLFLSTLSLRRATFSRPLRGNLDTISIHALLAESDRLLMCFWPFGRLFLSTLSLRRATRALRQLQSALCYFYPRSPCGERPSKLAKTSWTENISIHALLAESDSTCARRFKVVHYFYPRSPCGERPRHGVSIIVSDNHFYPRSPCGERPLCHAIGFSA